MRKVTVGLCVLLLMAGIGMAKSKVMFVDSYHAGYAWSDGILKGICNGLGIKMKDGKIEAGTGSVELKVIHMDTKLFNGLTIEEGATPEEIAAAKVAFIEEAALKVKGEIEAWQPDVVIAADDNASKYLIVPHFKDSEIPFVFCGVNWDASGYGFPCRNVTGMVEVALVPQLLDALKPHAKGEKIGFLGVDNLTSRKEAENYKTKFKLNIKDVYVENFQQWKTAYTDIQKEVDILIIDNNAGIKDWDDAQAVAHVKEATRIPTGCIYDFITPYAMVGFTKLADEQGYWAAETASRILDGKKPKDIPVVANEKGQLYLNLEVAQKLGIKFPLQMVKNAQVVGH